MINPYNFIFLSPTKEFRRLSLLLAMHEKPDSSQHSLGRTTHLSSSMVNSYIKSLKEQQLISVMGENNRDQSYHLTSMGQKQLMESILLYSAEIVQLYGSVKREIAKILNLYYEEGIRIVVLFGAAETAEVVHAALKETPLIAVGIVDSNKAKQGKPFNGHIIKAPSEIGAMRPDAVVITSFAKQEEIYDSLETYIQKGIKVKKLSDLYD